MRNTRRYFDELGISIGVTFDYESSKHFCSIKIVVLDGYFDKGSYLVLRSLI